MNKLDIVNRMYAAAVNNDWDEVGKYITPDFAVIESDGTPYAGRYEGADGFRRVVRKVFSYFPEFSIEQKTQIAGDDLVVVLIAIRGKGRKTGRPFESEVVELLLFEGDRISQIRPFYWDQKLLNEV